MCLTLCQVVVGAKEFMVNVLLSSLASTSPRSEQCGGHIMMMSQVSKVWPTVPSVVSLLPSVIIMKPMSDLCWTCQHNSPAVIRMANCSEAEKSDVLKVAEEHLRVVEVERKFYKSTVEACRQSVRAHYTVNGKFEVLPRQVHFLCDEAGEWERSKCR